MRSRLQSIFTGVVGILISVVSWSSAMANPMQGCCRGQKLKVGIKVGDHSPWSNTSREYAGQVIPSEDISGFTVKVMDAITNIMGVEYQWYGFDPAIFNTGRVNYTSLQALLDIGTIDLMLWDKVHPLYFAPDLLIGKYPHTMELYQSYVSGLVTVSAAPYDLWKFLQPLDAYLWGVVAAAVVGTALLMAAFRVLVPNASQVARKQGRANGGRKALAASLAREVLAALYHACAAFLQGDDYEWVSVPERILRLGLFVFGVILVATYTANLAAFLTNSRYTINGPQSMSGLALSTACSSQYQDQIGNFVKTVISPPVEKCGVGWTECGQDFCMEQLQSGNANIWLDDYHALHRYQVDTAQCSGLAETPSIRVLRHVPCIALVGRPGGESLTANFTAAILAHQEDVTYHDLVDHTFATNQVCQLGGGGNGNAAVRVRDMDGVYVFCGAIYGIAALSAAVIYGFRWRYGWSDVAIVELIQTKKQPETTAGVVVWDAASEATSRTGSGAFGFSGIDSQL